MTRDECRYCLEGLADVYGHKLQDVRVNSYFHDLQGYPLDVMLEAVTRLRRSEDSFPSLRKLLDVCRELGHGQGGDGVSGCGACEDGWRYKRREGGGFVCYPCTCTAGDMRQRQVADAEHRRSRSGFVHAV